MSKLPAELNDEKFIALKLSQSDKLFQIEAKGHSHFIKIKTHRLGRNFYKGVFGNAINAMLAATAYNFKRAMRVLLALFLFLKKRYLYSGIQSKTYSLTDRLIQ